MGNRFTKMSAAGELLADDAEAWGAVLDNTTNLIWDAGESSKSMTWKKALEYPKVGLAIGGFTDWRLPTVEELFCLADRTKFNPAIDTAFFPKCKGDWYWSSTVDASSPGDYAWGVYFDGGFAYCYRQGYEGLVRAVRARQ
jgi:hypothetical protein